MIQPMSVIELSQLSTSQLPFILHKLRLQFQSAWFLHILLVYNQYQVSLKINTVQISVLFLQCSNGMPQLLTKVSQNDLAVSLIDICKVCCLIYVSEVKIKPDLIIPYPQNTD